MIQTEGCRVCACKDATWWAQENGFSAVKCNSCSLVYLSPWPDLSDRDRSLQHGAHAGDKTIDTNAKPGGAAVVRRYESILDDLYGTTLTGSRVKWLDIGCGYGEFLTALQGRVTPNSILAGSEPNTRKAGYARERGLDVSYEAHPATGAQRCQMERAVAVSVAPSAKELVRRHSSPWSRGSLKAEFRQ